MKRQEGFTLIELMVVILIIGILVAIAVPVFFAARGNAQEGACRDNMRTIESALMTYSASAPNGVYPATGIAACTTALEGDFIKPPFPTCPEDGSAYTYTAPGAAGPYDLSCPNGHTY